MVEEKRKNMDPYLSHQVSPRGIPVISKESIKGTIHSDDEEDVIKAQNVRKLYLADIQTDDLHKVLKLQEKMKLEHRKN